MIIDEDDAAQAQGDVNVRSDDFITGTTKEDETDRHDDSSYLTTQDTSDFLYQEMKQEENTAEVTPDSSEVDGYLTEIVEEDGDDRPKDYEKRLDEIDKLILEISEKSN